MYRLFIHTPETKEEMIQMNNSLFRKTFFGGLNKEDVEEYIQNLEHEIESVKVLHQKEKADLLKKIDEYEEKDAAEKEGLLQKELEAVRQKLKNTQEEMQTLREKNQRLEENRAKGTAMEEENGGHPGRAGGEASFNGEEIEALRKEYNRIKQENKELYRELDRQKNVQEGEADDALFDYSTVSKIIEQANRNAESIKQEARLEAEKMLESVQKEVDQERTRVASQVNAQLEEKGIQLMAAKYKIEQYIKEIDSLQQGMYNLSSRMSKLVNNMPVRLDDYWEGEHYRMLESRKSRNGEKKQEADQKPEG